MYVTMDRKPENRADIQNAACGRSGFMIRLRIFKSVRNKAEQEDDEENLPRGTKVLKELVLPWANTDRIVCAESYFESVLATEEFCKHGLRFVDVIKMATRQFPMAYLSNIELQNRGDMSGFLTRPVDRTKPVLGDFF